MGVRWSILALCYGLDVNRQIFGDLPTIQYTVRCHEYARQFLEMGADLNADFFYVVHFMLLGAIQNRDEEAKATHGNALLRCMDMFTTGLLGELLTRLGVNLTQSDVSEVLNNPYFFPPLAREALGAQAQESIMTIASILRISCEAITEGTECYHALNLAVERMPGANCQLEAPRLSAVFEYWEYERRNMEEARVRSLIGVLAAFESIFELSDSLRRPFSFAGQHRNTDISPLGTTAVIQPPQNHKSPCPSSLPAS